MLLSRARERDVVGNTIPVNMAEAVKRQEELSEATIKEVEEGWEDWGSAVIFELIHFFLFSLQVCIKDT
jgi:hypothetical protein